MRTGVIDAICSDHQPLNKAAKLAPFAETLPGMSTLETVLPLGLRLVANGDLSAMELVRALTFNPAKVLGISAGDLSQSTNGVLLIDPDLCWTASGDDWLSTGQNSLYFGRLLQGKVRQHLV